MASPVENAEGGQADSEVVQLITGLYRLFCWVRFGHLRFGHLTFNSPLKLCTWSE